MGAFLSGQPRRGKFTEIQEFCLGRGKKVAPAVIFCSRFFEEGFRNAACSGPGWSTGRQPVYRWPFTFTCRSTFTSGESDYTGAKTFDRDYRSSCEISSAATIAISSLCAASKIPCGSSIIAFPASTTRAVIRFSCISSIVRTPIAGRSIRRS